VIAVVGGLIATMKVGGVFWDYAQYALGLEQLGLDVYYLEDTALGPYTPDNSSWGADLDATADYLRDTLAAVSPTLGSRWHYRANDGRTYGLDRAELAEVLGEAVMLLNVSGVTLLRPEYHHCRRKVLIDTDPGANHFQAWPSEETRGVAAEFGYRAHDVYFTYAERLGRPGCTLPDLGLDWHPTRPPVVLDWWAHAEPPGPAWTTVLSWNTFREPIEWLGRRYGGKELEFPHIADLPGQVAPPLQIAAGGSGKPVEAWRTSGWDVVDGPTVTASPKGYRRYLQRSRGEISVAKHVYRATGSGWFSCRSTCYLAAGRPVVVQDTGFSAHLPTGEGVLAFTDGAEAAAAIAAVEDDWEQHAAAARRFAADHFAAERVLGDMLDRIGA
jgi:hypothetical protein